MPNVQADPIPHTCRPVSQHQRTAGISSGLNGFPGTPSRSPHPYWEAEGNGRRRWRRGERDGGDKINWKIKITPHQTTLGVQHAIIFTPKRWAWVQSSRPPSELWPQHQRASAVTNACHLWRGNSRRRKNITLCSALMRCRGDWVWMGWFIRAIICCLYMNLHFWCENTF